MHSWILSSFNSIFPSFYLQPTKLCENNKKQKKIVAIGWGECSLGATSDFNAHSERKMEKNANFSCNVLSIHHFRVELFIPLQFSHFTHTDFNIFYSFSYSIRRLLLCFNVSVIFFSTSLSLQIFLYFFFLLSCCHFSYSAIVQHYTIWYH